MGYRLVVNVLGPEGPGRDQMKQRVADALAGAGLAKIPQEWTRPDTQPTPTRHLRAVTASGDKQS